MFSFVADPVGNGLVASLARPGGNATGFASIDAAFALKWLELLKEVAPGTSRVVLLYGRETDHPTAGRLGVFRGYCGRSILLAFVNPDRGQIDTMTFTITYRDPRFAGFAGASVVTSEFQARVTLERLRREGYEVTNTNPRLARAPIESRETP